MTVKYIKYFLAMKVLFLITVPLPITLRAKTIPYKIDTWNINPETARGIFLHSKKTITINPVKKPYSNKIYEYILSINNKLRGKIKILRSDQGYTRDLLFVNNKLISVMEEHKKISSPDFRELFLKIKDIYGRPEIIKDKGLTTYSFKNNYSNVLLYAKPSGTYFNIKIYYYSRKLFATILKER